MKKTNKRLLLNKETVRALSGTQLIAAAGGLDQMVTADDCPQSMYPPCADSDSASKAATYAC